MIYGRLASKVYICISITIEIANAFKISNNDVPFLILTQAVKFTISLAREYLHDVSKNVSNFFTNFFHFERSAFLLSLERFYFCYIVYFLFSIETSAKGFCTFSKKWTHYGIMKFLFSFGVLNGLNVDVSFFLNAFLLLWLTLYIFIIYFFPLQQNDKVTIYDCIDCHFVCIL